MDDRYGTPAGFRIYHTARGRDVTTYTDDRINVELLNASEFIDSAFGAQFGGCRVGQREQIRDWPRTGVIDRNGYAVPYTSVPGEIENGTYEAAYVQLVTPGALRVNFTPNKYKSVSLEGALSVQFANANDAADVQGQYPAIGAALANVLCRDGLTSAFSARAQRV